MQWFKDDKLIKQSKFFQMESAQNVQTLSILEAFIEDEGLYKCVVTNPAGHTSTSASLKVEGIHRSDFMIKWYDIPVCFVIIESIYFKSIFRCQIEYVFAAIAASARTNTTSRCRRATTSERSWRRDDDDDASSRHSSHSSSSNNSNSNN